MEWPKVDPAIEIYPMPSFPTLEVSDFAASVQWYVDVLGFQHITTLPRSDGQPGVAHLRWAKYADLLLAPGDDASGEPRGRGITLYYALSENRVDEIAERASAAGADLLEGPVDQPWNVRSVTIADPDGYRLTFGFGPLKQMSWDELGQRFKPKSGEGVR